MHPLSASSARKTLMALLAGGLMAAILPACQGGGPVRSQPWQAFTLPPTRSAGDWLLPREPAERQRLNAVVRAQYTAFQECTWRYAGIELSRTISSAPPSPLVGRFGVDERGQVVWFEMEPLELSQYSLRECLSRQLVTLTFDPPPSGPVMLVFTIPQLKLR